MLPMGQDGQQEGAKGSISLIPAGAGTGLGFPSPQMYSGYTIHLVYYTPRLCGSVVLPEGVACEEREVVCVSAEC